jgi:6-phosphogluconolactonase/glucosamine-6-phosphate isomerase/deaminase
VASIFPNSAVLERDDRVYALVANAPKPPSLRITVTPHLLMSAAHAFLFFVDDKQEAYDLFLQEGSDAECPARMVKHMQQAIVCRSLRSRK